MADIEMADTMVSDKAQSDSETAAPASEPAGADAPERAEPSSRCDYALFSESGSAYVAKIIIGKRRRALDPAKVDELATSIRQRGLLQAIVVTPAEPVEARLRGRKKVYASRLRLVAGWHRLEAVKKLGWRAIPATVIPEGHDLECELCEIDENLVRAELTELERSEHLAARKAIYEQLHPETKAGAAQALGMHQALGHNVEPILVPTFTKDTAAKSRLSKTTINRDIRRAEKIAPEVRDQIRAMPKIADSGVELDALAKVSPAEQAAAVEAVKTGEAKNVREALCAVSKGLSEQDEAPTDCPEEQTGDGQVAGTSHQSGAAPHTEDSLPAQPFGVKSPPMPTPAEQPPPATPFSLRDLPFDEAFSQFAAWYATLTPEQHHQVDEAMMDVEATARQRFTVLH